MIRASAGSPTKLMDAADRPSRHEGRAPDGRRPFPRAHRHAFTTRGERCDLADALRLSWKPKVTQGFFLRAESFYDFAAYVERVGGAGAVLPALVRGRREKDDGEEDDGEEAGPPS
jgi:hypothetical protein